MKLKSLYRCKECGQTSPKWAGQCNACKAWNSFTEETINETVEKLKTRSHNSIAPKTVTPLKLEKSTYKKLKTGISELDRTLGDGFTPASATLLGGEPGIGKSTLTLQLANQIAIQNKKLLYVSGEESLNQVASRAERLKLSTENILFLQENNLESTLSTIENEKPYFLIIDSIQTISSFDASGIPGSISQTITVTERLIEYCKTHNITLLLIGHVTKEGSLAGPKMIEHLVDTVLILEGDRQHQHRILRTNKNRFGSTNEIGLFEMKQEGLVEMKNPSLKFLQGRNNNSIGSIFTMTMEGNRPLLTEIQALTNPSPFGYPKRTANGFDLTKLHIITAVLQKHSKIKLNEQDIFINVVGGFKVNDPAVDLAVAMAINSSFYKQEISSSLAVIGEIGLSGEIRQVSNIELRLKELEKLGITNVVIPNIELSNKYQKLNIKKANNIKDATEISAHPPQQEKQTKVTVR